MENVVRTLPVPHFQGGLLLPPGYPTRSREMNKVNSSMKQRPLVVIYIFERSSTINIGVERVSQVSKLTITEAKNIVYVAVNCVQIVEQILRQRPRSALSTSYREYDVKVLQHWSEWGDRSTLNSQRIAD